VIHQNEVFGDLGGVLLTKPSFIKQIIPKPKLLLQLLHPKSDVPTGSNHELEQVDLHFFGA